jgi:demethylmenaquinone methyltransferase / 2-methoxy-6-polyprenyl-1,4-benzoquinol methylase
LPKSKIQNKYPVVPLFQDIAPVYDRLNRIISWGLDPLWRRDLVRRMNLQPGYTVLDISTGTGDVALAAGKVCPECIVVGLDPASNMIELFRRKSPSALVTLGIAENLPLRDGSVDRALCSFGLRNFSDRAQGYAEIRRVLKPGGLWGFLEMTAPPGRFFPVIFGFYFKRIVPLLGAVISLYPGAYKYLRDSVYAFPGYEGMKTEHESAGFSLVYYRAIMRGAVGLFVFRKI